MTKNGKTLKSAQLKSFFMYRKIMRNTNHIRFFTASTANTIEFCRVDLAKGYLSADLDMKLSLDSIAREIGLSRFHFIRMFKKHTGLSPHQFRIQHRIDAAKILIQKGVPFSEIALETGFSDQSHFTNTFRQSTGLTPSQYAHRF